MNGIDPLGAFAWPALSQGFVNASAGFGDALSFGLTGLARHALGIGSVEECSGLYKGGQLAAIIPGLIDGAGEAELAASSYEDTTAAGALIRNITTDVSAEEAGATLEANGFTANVSSDGRATIYTNSSGDQYIVRPSNSSPGGAAMDYSPSNGGPSLKINLGAGQ